LLTCEFTLSDFGGAVTATEHVIQWSTAGAVVGVAAVAAVASYGHAYALVRVHGEAGWTG
jgi:hypothetical protein